MDYAVALPEGLVTGATNILIVVDRLTRGVVFTLIRGLNTEELADTFIRNIVAYYGFPLSIISDRGAQFASRF